MKMCKCGSTKFERGATFHSMQVGTVAAYDGKFTPEYTTDMESVDVEDELCCVECGEELVEE